MALVKAKAELVVLYAANEDLNQALEASGVDHKSHNVRICNPRYFSGLESGCVEVLFYDHARFKRPDIGGRIESACKAAKIKFSSVAQVAKKKAAAAKR